MVRAAVRAKPVEQAEAAPARRAVLDSPVQASRVQASPVVPDKPVAAPVVKVAADPPAQAV